MSLAVKKMDKCLEEIICTSCQAIPKKEIYQCPNGHIFCDICDATVSACPQCQLALGRFKIRSRALENVLDNLKIFDCKYKEKGCNSKMARKEIDEHGGICEFGGSHIKFCAKMAIPCDFILKTRKLEDFYTHFASHKLVMHSNKGSDFVLESLDKIVFDRKCVWGPQFINLESVKNVTVVSYCYFNNLDQTISLLCTQFAHEGDQIIDNEIFAEFRIKSVNPSEKPDIVWITVPVDIKFSGNSLISPRFPLKLLLDHYTVEYNLNANFSVNSNASKSKAEKDNVPVKLVPHKFM